MSDAERGYQPNQPSARGFSFVLAVLAAAMAATWLLDDYIGDKATTSLLRLVMSSVFIVRGIRDILHPERDDDAVTDREQRNLRILGIVMLIVFTAIGTLSIQNLFFPE